jgi:hypothetical protein
MLRMAMLFFVRFSWLVLSMACASSTALRQEAHYDTMVQEVHHQVAKEYQCAYKEVHVEELGEGRFQVTGCGYGGLYNCKRSNSSDHPYDCFRHSCGYAASTGK